VAYVDLPQDWIEIIVKLLLATGLSALVGLEREVRNKPAGLRTHMLVGLGAAAVCVFAYGMADSFDTTAEANEVIKLDMIRVISGVIGGLGFLGGGAILQSRGEVQGMTTAAGIWIVGGIGIGCGTGNYFAVIVTTLIAVACLIPARLLERSLATKQTSGDDKATEQNQP